PWPACRRAPWRPYPVGWRIFRRLGGAWSLRVVLQGVKKYSSFQNTQGRRLRPIVAVHQYHPGGEALALGLLHPSIGDDDDKIALLRPAGGCAIDADGAGAGGGGNGISRE